MKAINQRIIKAAKKTGLPVGEYAVFGSGILDVLGIRKSSDLDLILTKNLFTKLVKDGWERFNYPNGDEGIKNEALGVGDAFYYCTNIPRHKERDIRRMIKEAVIIDGVPFTSLENILQWKIAWGREKDLRDVRLIKEYLEEEK